MNNIKVTRKKLADYVLDPENPNRGSVRGNSMLENSIEDFGAARSGVADKDGVIRAGNHTAEQLKAAGIDSVIEVETSGSEWVIVRRTDMDAATGKIYAVADNRVAEVGIDWDRDLLKALATQSQIDLKEYWSGGELAALLDNRQLPQPGDAKTDEIPAIYGVLIECNSEKEQTAILNKLLKDGIECRALLS